MCTNEDPECQHKELRRSLATSCTVGNYLNGGGTCLTCPEGYTCAGGTALPVICGAGTYTSTGATSCIVSI